MTNTLVKPTELTGFEVLDIYAGGVKAEAPRVVKKIWLSGQKGSGLFALVDAEDFERLHQYSWTLFEGGYAKRGEYDPAIRNNRTVLMHHEVLGLPSKNRIDHKNHNGLDNRKQNLRPATSQQNMRNIKKKVGVSRYKGVSWDKSRSKWMAKIAVDKRTINLGRFSSETDAARAYDTAATELFGEFANCNFATSERVS